MSVSEPPEPARGRTAEQRRSAPSAASEPAEPQRGLTAEESTSDASAAERELEAAPTGLKRFWAAAKPGFLLSQADGYPIGIKQFLQFSLILVYPAWLFGLIVLVPLSWAVYKVCYGVLWVVFWPLRLVVGRKDTADKPEEGTTTG
jgi:YggT family protein